VARGPCWLATDSRYCLKEVGREEVGEAGWTRGAWSMVSGTERLPMKLMSGVRRARIRVGFIVAVGKKSGNYCMTEVRSERCREEEDLEERRTMDESRERE